jgi:hypothetical protein
MGAFHSSRDRAVAHMPQKTLGTATTVLALACIAFLTLRSLGGPLPSGFHWCVFCGQTGVADFIDNVILFVPLGLGLRLAGLRRRYALAIVVALTASIETAQYWVISGRDSALGDLLANTAGGILGIALVDARHALGHPAPTTARALALASALALCATAAAIQWIARPSLPPPPYWSQVATRLPQYVPFDGTVLGVTYDGHALGDGPLPDSTSATIRATLLAGSDHVTTTIVPISQPKGDDISPVVSLYDRAHEEVLIVGCVDSALAMRVRTRAVDLKLHGPTAVVANGCAPAGDTIRVAAQLLPRGAGVRLTATHGSWTATTTRHASLSTGWHLLVPDLGRYAAPLTGVFTILWMLALYFPVGYWSARARRLMFVLTVSLFALFAPLALIPILAGAAVATPGVWIFSITGLVLGFTLSRMTISHHPPPSPGRYPEPSA